MRVRTVMRHGHRGLGLAGALGLLVLAASGLVLMHPEWLGPPTVAGHVVGADPWRAGRLLRAAPFLLEESGDGGATWRELPLRMAPGSPVSLAFAAHDSGEVWLMGATELLVSRDGGTVWQDAPMPASVGFDEPARGLALARAGQPVVTTDFHGWRRDPATGSWLQLWHRPPDRAQRWRAAVKRLHNGHWGPPAVARIYDVVAVALVLVVITGLGLSGRRNGRNGRNGHP